MGDRKIVIKNVDMKPEMLPVVYEKASEAMEKFIVDGNKKELKEIAAFLKREFDKKFGTTWQCIVGNSFGAWVTYEKGNYIYFYIGQWAILLYKSD